MSNSQLGRTLCTLAAVPVCRRVAFHSLCASFSLARRHYVRPVVVDKTQLPPRDEWRKHFATNGELMKRYTLRNPETAKTLAETLVPEGSKDRIIIEANPGPGELTRALLALPADRIKRVVVLEDNPMYLEYLRPLQEIDPRVLVIEGNPKMWTTYTKARTEGGLDGLETLPWSAGINHQLVPIIHVGNSVWGEQLVAQLFRTIPNRQWYFQYGRIQAHFVMSVRMWDRLKAPIKTQNRCKVSVVAQATAECTELVDPSMLAPFAEHFHPSVHRLEQRNSYLDTRKIGNPVTAITLTPLEHQVIEEGDLDYWDYCLRKLFVQKATPLVKSVSLLGPNASILLTQLTSENLPADQRVDITKAPRNLEIHEWKAIVGAFKAWPFRPEDLSVDTFFS